LKVTILLAALDRLDMLKKSVASALKQDFIDYEVLVIDDGSNEETRHWLDEEVYRENNLRVIHQRNHGIAHARQKGLEEARGEFVCILDSDDLLVPGALRQLVTPFILEPTTALVYCNNRHRMPDGGIREYRYPRFYKNEAMLRSILIRPRIPFKHSGTTYRKNEALKLGGYDVQLPIKVDIDFILKFLKTGQRFTLIEEPLVEFYMHKNSVSARRILGIRVWWILINRYGPENIMSRFIYKIFRTIAEFLKFIYLYIRL
jgi:glycosyltransferase involved in cell wall biosynthesis